MRSESVRDKDKRGNRKGYMWNRIEEGREDAGEDKKERHKEERRECERVSEKERER